MKKIIISIIFLSTALILNGSDKKNKTFAPAEDGSVPVWLIAGPFNQKIHGFGNTLFEFYNNNITESPAWGNKEKSILVRSGNAEWVAATVDNKGFLNFNDLLSWQIPSDEPVKKWFSKAAYASIKINSKAEQDVYLLAGSNFGLSLSVNGDSIYTNPQIRNAAPDTDTVKIHLNKGINTLTAKVWNSQENYMVSFFLPTLMEWGLYARIVDEKFNPVTNISYQIEHKEVENSFKIQPTFFYKKENGKLFQKINLFINSVTDMAEASFYVEMNGEKFSFDLGKISFGKSRHEIFIPEIMKKEMLNAELKLDDKILSENFDLKPAPKYKMHVVMLSHTDIGYTHTQPIVKELQTIALDEVIEFCNNNPDFRWTIETTWQLDQYRKARSPEKFNELIKLIKNGRISVSPFYTNPFTGWVSREEMINSLNLARKYKEEFGIEYKAVVYNDVPGESWALPQLMKLSGTNLVINGINEVYDDYIFQRNLPKAFLWEGSEGSKVINYITETYVEGLTYGLERDNGAVENRLWQRLNKIQNDDYPYDVVLVNAAYLDNAGIPKKQYTNMLKWNEKFEYPKFISSNLNMFADAFNKTVDERLKVLSGDWTSNWDVLYQGEPKRNIAHRKIQNRMPSIEKLASINSLLHPEQSDYSNEINSVYESMLHFSGHGSGLEYGYGSPEENKIAMDFREGYVEEARRKAQELKERTMFKLHIPDFTFDNNGIMVFNPLSFERDAVVDIQFPENKTQLYEVYDLTNNQKVTSHQNKYKLTFIAEKLPSVGYKKYKLNPVNIINKNNDNGLKFSSSSIENKFYKVKLDKTTGKVKSIFSKINKKEMVKNDGFGFNDLLVERYQKKTGFISIGSSDVNVEVIDNLPVSVSLIVSSNSNLIESKTYTLWNDLDRVDITNKINLEMLKETEYTEEYGVAFPFNIPNQKFQIDLLSGLTQPGQKLLASANDAYSIRSGIGIHNENETIALAVKDNRIIRVKKNGNEKTVISNIVNNFPYNWNRHEENEGVIVSRYSLKYIKGEFKADNLLQFMKSFSAAPTNAVTWFKTDPAKKSFFKSENSNIELTTIKSLNNSNEYEFHLINIDNNNEQESMITSEFFNGADICLSNLMGDKISDLELTNNKVNLKFERGGMKILKVKIK